jgi:hypothetical protein
MQVSTPTLIAGPMLVLGRGRGANPMFVQAQPLTPSPMFCAGRISHGRPDVCPCWRRRPHSGEERGAWRNATAGGARRLEERDGWRSSAPGRPRSLCLDRRPRPVLVPQIACGQTPVGARREDVPVVMPKRFSRAIS